MTSNSNRREFLRWSAGFSVLGGVGPFALQLTAAGSAAAATATDYKAVVCMFLQGGADSNNMILATDADSWGRYISARGNGASPIALMPAGTPVPTVPVGTVKDQPKFWGGVLPIVPKTVQAIPEGTLPGIGPRTFALHPLMAPLAPKVNPATGAPAPDGTSVWEQGRLAILANVGTLITPLTKAQFEGKQRPIPPALGSHNDQQSAWQAGGVDGAQTGWGGRLADMLVAQNAAHPVFSSVSAAGNAVFVAGNVVNQYQVNTQGDPGVTIGHQSGTLFGSKTGGATLKAIITNNAQSSSLANDYADVTVRSIGAASAVNQAFSSDVVQNVLPTPEFDEPLQGFQDQNPWLDQMRTVAQMIAAAPALGMKRQVFFVQLDGFDTHDNQSPREARNLAQLAQAMVYFDQALGALGLQNNVTTFTASDFSRGYATNGTGTDHAWGGHHMIMGGAVNGGDMFGQYPTLGVNVNGFNNPNISGNNMIPTTSVDQYGATIAKWFGLSDSQIHDVFPNLANFAVTDLGFMKT